MRIEIAPVALERPRVTVRGTYLPKRSQKFREEFQQLVREAFGSKPLDMPLAVTLHFHKPVKESSRKYGDIDNLAKAVLDAANGILWQDDAQIVELHCYKHKGAGKIILEVEECT